MIELVLQENWWFSAAMVVATLALVASAVADARRATASRLGAGDRMNLFYGCVIGVMGFGHLLAITLKLVLAEPLRLSLWLLYPLGIALAAPAVWLVAEALRRRAERASRTALLLNGWLALTLLASGVPTLPLALPALLNIVHGVYGSRIAVRRATIAVTGLLYLALFAGSLAFLASGQTFEQFSGIE